MNLQSIADKLEVAEQKENDGRGIQTVKSIVKALRRGDLEYALAVYATDGDKTRAYARVEKIIQDTLGCRSHHIIGCTKKLCADLYAYTVEECNWQNDMPWCDACKSYHAIPKDKQHHAALQCRAPWI